MPTETFRGVWWLPESPDVQVPGDLTFTHEDGLRLELRGALNAPDHPLQALTRTDIDAYPRMLGRVSGMQPVTLVDCLTVRRQLGTGQASQTLRPHMAFVGRHPSSEGPMLWKHVRFRFRHLLEWLGNIGVTQQFHPDEHRATLEYQEPAPLKAGTENWRVELRGALSFADREFLVPRWEPYAEFHLTLPLPADYEWLARLFIAPLQDLVTMAAGEPCWLTHLSVAEDGSSESQPGARVLAASHRAAPDTPDQLRRWEWLFTAASLGAERFEEIVPAWLVAAWTFRDPRALLFEEFYRGPTPLENRFLLSALAAESFHAALFPDQTTEVSDEVYEGLLQVMLDAVPEEHREWLRDALMYSNKVSFRRRVRELYRRVQPVSGQLATDREDFVSRVVAWRNDLVHKARIEDLNPQAVLHVSESLRFILQASLLVEAGFTAEECAGFFSRTRRFQNAIAWGQPTSDP